MASTKKITKPKKETTKKIPRVAKQLPPVHAEQGVKRAVSHSPKQADKVPQAKQADKVPQAKQADKVPQAKQAGSYYGAIGRRKTAVARVRLFTQGEKTFSVNQKPCQEYFPSQELQKIAKAPLVAMDALKQFKVSILVKGGGFHAQAEAVRHGIARALNLFNADFHAPLKKNGYLTRDSRMRERKKFGLKRARRAPQWKKR